ncbi:hypothetical protein SAMN05720468_10649 [Fibrobacter sp. UWEL]|nr:hypothetical protein SAMN05720468_10649 [Fibrobacter sp. UWEL]
MNDCTRTCKMKFRKKILLVTLMFTTWATADHTPLQESQIFDWWDDGLITAEEAGELLDLIQDGNFEEACLLSQALALESCEEEKTVQKRIAPSLTPEGYVSWTARMDSLGMLERHFTDLNIRFYRYSLHLGTHSQLAYKNHGSEAYFGQISTRELHSQIPTDTLWGTGILYPVGKFQLQASLDTALHWNTSLGYKFQKNVTASLFYWDGFRRPRELALGGIQLKTPWLDFAGWYQRGQDAPLLKLRLHQKSTAKSAGGTNGKSSTVGTGGKPPAVKVSWQTTAYYHGTDIPEIARLSPTLLKNEFTGTQQVSATVPALWNSRLTANAQVSIPQENDATGKSQGRADIPTNALKGRLKVSAESGPDALRGLFSITCLEAESHCPENDLRVKLTSGYFQQFTLEGAIKSRHTRGEGFSVPQSQVYLTYHPADQIKARMVLQFPKGSPRKNTQIRTETTVGTNHIQSQLLVTFRKIRNKEFHPVHGIVQVKWLF